MAMDEVLAAILGGLQGGVDGWQVGRQQKEEEKRRKAIEERQRQQDALAAQDRRDRMGERERGRVTDVLDTIGRDELVDPALAASAQRYGLGHRLRPEETLTSSFFTGYSGTPGDDLAGGEIARTPSPGRPTGRMLIAPTKAERLADTETATAKKRIDEIAAQIADPAERQAFLANPSGYKPTRESFLSVPLKLREAQQVEDAKIDAEVRKGKALLPIKLREKEENERLQRKYATPPAPRDEPLVVVDGPDGPVYVRRSEALGKKPPKPASASRPSTGAERQAMAYYTRMDQAVGDLEAVEDSLTEKDLWLINNSSLPDLANNAMLSEAGQQYAQALRTYTEARLRKESGAAIAQHEFDSDRKAVARQVNEKALDQKKKTRRTTLKGLKFSAGKAYDEFYGDGAGAGSAGAGEPKVGDVKTFPNGRKGVWDGNGWRAQ